MLPRQPLRFLLADDPGAGKTIMAGLLIKELIVRGDLERCLVVAPGSLVEQWQDELAEKFGLEFEILTRDRSRPPHRQPVRRAKPLDRPPRQADPQRGPSGQARSRPTGTSSSATRRTRCRRTYFGGEVKKTKRYQLGQRSSASRRHLLLMTATPHSGKEEDFQLFMALLDGDRFEGRPRRRHTRRHSDLMRRMVKEELLTFEGKPLFPSGGPTPSSTSCPPRRRCSTTEVTDYVREEMNRADRLADGRGRAGTSSASRSRSCSAGWRPRRRRSTSRCAAAASGWSGGSTRSAARQRGRDARLDAPRVSSTTTRTSTTSTRPETSRGPRGRARRSSATAAQTIAELETEIAALASSKSWPAMSAARHRHEVARAARILDDSRDVRRPRQPAQADHLHRAPRHAQLPRRADPHAARHARGGRRDPRRPAPRGAAQAARSASRTTRTVRCWSPPTPPARASTSSAPT